MRVSEYRVRPMQPDDLTGAEALFEAAYGAPMGPEHRQWFIRANPYSNRIGYVAESEDGRIVGHVSYIPVPFRRNGKRVLGAFMIQAMIHPDFQKKGIFKALVAACETQHDADHVEVIQAFPNDNSVHAFIANFGWEILDGPNYIYFRVLDWAAAIRGKLHSEVLASVAAATLDRARRFPRARPRSTWTIRRVERFDERLDSLWKRFSARTPNAIERDADYLNWRLGEHSDRYSIYLAETGGELSGAVVTKREHRFGLDVGYIVELLFDPDLPSVGHDLLTHAVDALRTERCAVALAATSGSPAVRRALYRARFWHLPRRVMPHGIHFVYKIRSSTTGRRNPYFVSWLDHDLL